MQLHNKHRKFFSVCLVICVWNSWRFRVKYGQNVHRNGLISLSEVCIGDDELIWLISTWGNDCLVQASPK
jgi:hypothetical protein